MSDVSIEYFNAQCRQSGTTLHHLLNNKGVIALYALTDNALLTCYAIAANNRTPIFNVVSNPSEADIFITDDMYNGNTQQETYPNTPTYAIGNVLPISQNIAGLLLDRVGEDKKRGGLLETPKRFMKAWEHFTSGYAKDPKDILKVFEDGAESYDEMVLVKNIPVYSQCEHHLVPFFGVAHVAYIPDGKIVGLSKLSRIVDIFARRLQVQERLTHQVATTIEEGLSPKGVAVVLECRHLCMEARGICQQGHTTVTSSMQGVFRDSSSARAEFMGLIK